MDAVSQLIAAMARALQTSFEPPVVPPMLHEELDALKRLLRGAGGGAPSRDRLREAVALFRASREIPNLMFARAVCFGACEKFDRLEPPLIEEGSAFPELLDRIDAAYRPEPRPFRRCYRGLLHSYFTYDGDTPETSAAGRKNWTLLRDYLRDRRYATESEGTQPEWLEFLGEHPNLVTDDPASRYAAELLHGNKEALEKIKVSLDVSDKSWLMRRLVLAQIRAATRTSDREFKRLVDALLHMLEGHDVLEDEGLTLILNRYASSAAPKLHIGLRDRAVKSWGNPWLDKHSAKWTLASAEARRLVTGWFKLHVIRTFFETLSEDGRTDPRRVRFWEKYYEQIGDMYFALGSTTRYARGADAKRMREEMGGRLLGLRNAGPGANNAFIMMIGDIVAVEFGMSGHACFLYRRDSLPFELSGEVSGSTDRDGLRSPDNLERLTHVDTRRGTWEENFAEALRRHGTPRSIREDRDRRAPASDRIGSLSRQRLQEFCDAHGLVWQDNLAKGGILAVRFRFNAGGIADRLKSWGFIYSDQKQFWWRKSWS